MVLSWLNVSAYFKRIIFNSTTKEKKPFSVQIEQVFCLDFLVQPPSQKNPRFTLLYLQCHEASRPPVLMWHLRERGRQACCLENLFHEVQTPLEPTQIGFSTLWMQHCKSTGSPLDSRYSVYAKYWYSSWQQQKWHQKWLTDLWQFR